MVARPACAIITCICIILAMMCSPCSCHELEESRTFGRPIRKLQAAMLPIMFKLGVMATLIFLTFLLALKGVVIGKMLLLLKLFGLVLKLKSAWHPQPYHHYPEKSIHLHVSSPHGHHYHQPWSSPEPYGGGTNEAWSRFDTLAKMAQAWPSLMSTNLESNLRGPGAINTPYGHYVRTGDPTAPSTL